MDERLIGTLCARSGRLDQWCRDAMDIDGVKAIDLTPQPKLRPTPGLSLSFQGWSPSLHSAWIMTNLALPVGIDDETALIEVVKSAFADVARRQRRRAADAAALGHRSPLRNGMVGHLLMDEAISAIASEGGTDLVELVRSTIGAIHNGTQNTHGGGVEFGQVGQSVAEHAREGHPALRFAMPRARLRAPGSRRARAEHMGHRLRIYADHLPETLLAALVGQPLSSLANLHPLLDSRIIRRAENEGRAPRGTILIGLDQHLEPIEEKP